ncbi:MAG: ATP-dependent DNA helicase RecQ [Vicingaceae bacterium]
MSVDKIHKILLQFWGYASFREKQEDIIRSVLEGKDTLALLPTGGGKSICFQVPALAQEGICIVVSPLIALMQDQVDNLQKNGIKALAISSALSKREIDIALDNAAYGDFKFLYVSPERLETELFQARLKKMNVNLIAIDEAHCISQWGYDFRPAYLNIANLRELLPDVPLLALTATATPKVVEDIQEKLAFKKKNVLQKSFERKNLAYVVLHEEDQYRRMLKVISGVKGSGIVYANRRKKCKEVANFLQQNQISADYYHAGLNHTQRKAKQEAWINNRTQVIVATNAFGMGIDKPDVRFVIHLDLPESLEAYFQEAGRGGRDGQKSFAVLLMSPSMGADLKKQVEQSFPEIKTIKQVYQCLGNFLQIPINGGENQSFDFNIAEFAERFSMHPIEAYHSLHFLEKEGYLTLSENFSTPSRLHICKSKKDLYQFQVSNPTYDGFIKGILRTYGGLFEGFVKINEQVLAKNLKLSPAQVIAKLKHLDKLELLDYEAQSSLPKLTLIQARLDQEALRISKANYLERKQIAFEKLDSVLRYAESNDRCRSQLLLEYFGEKDSYRCGICDVCLERNKLDLNDMEFEEIQAQLHKIMSEKPLPLKEVVAKVKGYKENQTLKVIDFLLDTGELKTDGLEYQLAH